MYKCDPKSTLSTLNCDICEEDNGKELILDVVAARRLLNNPPDPNNPSLSANSNSWLYPNDRE